MLSSLLALEKGHFWVIFLVLIFVVGKRLFIFADLKACNEVFTLFVDELDILLVDIEEEGQDGEVEGLNVKEVER